MSIRVMLYRAFLILAIVGFIYSGGKLGFYLYDGYKSEQLNRQMKEYYQQAASNTEYAEQSSSSESSLNRYEALQAINRDYQGWLDIAGTTISYPVLQTTNNDYYLTHSLEHKKSARGSIFMDYRNHVEDRHIVIYGHHMRDGSMFGELDHYKEASYYKEHSIITLDLQDGVREWEIFSVYIYSPEDQSFQFEFSSDEDYISYLHEIKQRSRYDTAIELTDDEEQPQLLTLVTCTYEINDARLIIHALSK